MRRSLAVLLAALLSLSAAARADEIRVAAAISLKESVEEIAAVFKTNTGNTVQFSFGSSGAMVAQIKNGADTDLFLSAANKQMDDLAAAHLIDPQTRRVIAKNALVLIVPADSTHIPADFPALANPVYHHIAVGEATTVPAGQYAKEVLDNLQLTDTLKDRLIYGANVRQVLVYVERGEAEAGIVYTTDAKAPDAKVKIAATADPSTHSSIEYPGALVTAGTHKPTAAQFLGFLATPDAQKILTAHGFTLPKSPETK